MLASVIMIRIGCFITNWQLQRFSVSIHWFKL